jgi:transposase
VDERQPRGQVGRCVLEDVIGLVRWVVERSVAWLGRNRRLSKNDEELLSTEEAWISLVMIRLMLARSTR